MNNDFKTNDNVLVKRSAASASEDAQQAAPADAGKDARNTNKILSIDEINMLQSQYDAAIRQNRQLQQERIQLISNNNFITAELNQIKLLLEGKNTEYSILKEKNRKLLDNIYNNCLIIIDDLYPKTIKAKSAILRIMEMIETEDPDLDENLDDV